MDDEEKDELELELELELENELEFVLDVPIIIVNEKVQFDINSILFFNEFRYFSFAIFSSYLIYFFHLFST